MYNATERIVYENEIENRIATITYSAVHTTWNNLSDNKFPVFNLSFVSRRVVAAVGGRGEESAASVRIRYIPRD